eukprot:gene12033-18586_t
MAEGMVSGGIEAVLRLALCLAPSAALFVVGICCYYAAALPVYYVAPALALAGILLFVLLRRVSLYFMLASRHAASLPKYAGCPRKSIAQEFSEIRRSVIDFPISSKGSVLSRPLEDRGLTSVSASVLVLHGFQPTAEVDLPDPDSVCQDFSVLLESLVSLCLIHSGALQTVTGSVVVISFHADRDTRVLDALQVASNATRLPHTCSCESITQLYAGVCDGDNAVA